jgi:hypothetical protein
MQWFKNPWISQWVKFIYFWHDILYYYVSIWIIVIVHDYIILKAFQIFKKMGKFNESTSYNVLCVFLNILSSLDPSKLFHVSS